MTASWPDISSATLGLPDTGALVNTPVSEVLLSLGHCERGQSYLSWYTYQAAAALHTTLVEPTAEDDLNGIDAYAQCAARIAIAHAISQAAAETLLREAVALRDRLPQVALCLRDGLLTRPKVSTIITGTDLCDGQDYAAEVDRDIAAAIRAREGVWSRRAIRDLTDRIVFRRDPAAVRERRKRAHDDRALWVDDDGDGMAVIAASMSAEDAAIAQAAVRALADAVCTEDPRTKRARGSDAAFALLSGTRFECLCGRGDCDAEIPETGTLPPQYARIVLHVVCDEATLIDPEDTTPGYMDGYGVVSADHVRDLAERPDTLIRPINPQPATVPPAKDESDPDQPRADDPDPNERDTDQPVSDQPVSDDATDIKYCAESAADDAVADRDGYLEPIEPADESDSSIGKPASPEPAPQAPPPPSPPPNRRSGLAPHLESDPYRPSTALTVYVHSRDGMCTVPGCTRSAWLCDLDHVCEYNHDDPAGGGQTEPSGIADKCRFHHLLKTFTDFLDDMTIGPGGRPHTTFTTPEGLVLPGRADSVVDVIPALGTIRFRPADTRSRVGKPRVIVGPGTPLPSRRTPRTAAKHARRQQERMRNRRRNSAGPAPPY
mgnify:CR=1 FL=1